MRRETHLRLLLLGEEWIQEWIGKIGVAEPGTPHFDIMCVKLSAEVTNDCIVHV